MSFIKEINTFLQMSLIRIRLESEASIGNALSLVEYTALWKYRTSSDDIIKILCLANPSVPARLL